MSENESEAGALTLPSRPEERATEPASAVDRVVPVYRPNQRDDVDEMDEAHAPDGPGQTDPIAEAAAAAGAVEVTKPAKASRPPGVSLRTALGAWFARIPVGYRVATVVFVILRLSVMMAVHSAFVLYDSQEYRPGKGTPAYPYVSFIGDAVRPWPVPFFYSLFPNDTLRMVAQVVLSIVAWLVLATAAGAMMRNRWIRAVTFGSVLIFGSSVYVLNWDFEILAESLSISFLALALAAWLRFTRRPTVENSIATVSMTTVAMFLRPQLLPMVVIIALVMLVWAARPGARIFKIAVGAALALVVVWGLVVVENVEKTSAGRTETVGLFTQNFVFVLQTRILPDPEVYEWFKAKGMPQPQYAMPAGPNDGGIQAVMRRYGSDRPLIDWITEHGQVALIEYSIRRPDKFPTRFLTDLSSMLVPNRGLLVYGNVPSIVPGPIEGFIVPTVPDPPPPTVPPTPTPPGPPPPPAIPPQIVFLALFAIAAVLPRRRPLDKRVVTTLVMAFVASLAGLYLGWVVSAMEPVRHAIPFTLFLPLCLLLGAFALFDALFRDPAQPDDDAATDAADMSLAAST